MRTKSYLVMAMGTILAAGIQPGLSVSILGLGVVLNGCKRTEAEAPMVRRANSKTQRPAEGKSGAVKDRASSGKSGKASSTRVKKSTPSPSPALESADWLIESLEAIERALPRSVESDEVNPGTEEGK